jgi:phosphatidylethanolamine-binding protein (PEBP) family uncharacterized protein
MRTKILYLFILVALLSACTAGNTPTVITSESVSIPDAATEPTLTSAATPGIAFILTSPLVIEGGRLPIEYTCDGDGSTLPLDWSGAPAGTAGYAVMMHHVATPDDIHWYWVLYDIPADITSLPENVSGIGTLGNNVNNGLTEYSPPCSKGPGDKVYTYTVYALSAQPQLTVPATEVDRDTLLAAIQGITLASTELNVVYARAGMSDLGSAPPDNPQGNPPGGNGQQSGNQPDIHGNSYNIDQAISDKAQGMTIAFDALAFLTGDLGSDSFFPPGKVADFWGFQYLRDNDTSEMGHAGDFLTSAAMNMLAILTPDQRAQLVALAESQVPLISEYGYQRFVLMDAFRRLLEGDLPAGTTGLDREAVIAYSAELYRLDGQISYARAELMGRLINEMDVDQLAYLDAMAGQGMLEWTTVEEPADIQGLDRDVKVAVMTYAADMFSWYAGSVEADVYFCPERHGTYFGSFYLKDIPAMSDSSYAIPTDLTGDMGDAMLAILNSDQAELITSLVDIQEPSLLGIVETRQQISLELRKFLEGGLANEASVLSLMAHYGELDGEIIYNMAVHFADVAQTLTDEQTAQLMALREEMLGDLIYPSGAYLYSQAISMPEIPNTDFLFK